MTPRFVKNSWTSKSPSPKEPSTDSLRASSPRFELVFVFFLFIMGSFLGLVPAHAEPMGSPESPTSITPPGLGGSSLRSASPNSALNAHRNCLAAQWAAARKWNLATTPDLEASLQAQAEPVPATGLDRTRTRSRIGLSYDLSDLVRAHQAETLASLECDAGERGAARLLREIQEIRRKHLLAGARAAHAVYQEELDRAAQLRSRIEDLTRAEIISRRDRDAFLNLLAELELRALELSGWTSEAAAGHNPRAEFSVRPEIAALLSPSPEKDASEDRVHQEFETLVTLALEEELKAAQTRAAAQAAETWNLRLAGGYESLSRTQGRATLPGYFTAEVKFRLGALWPESPATREDTPDANIGSNPAGQYRRELATIGEIGELAELLRDALATHRNDLKKWKLQHEVTLRRLQQESLQERLEAAGTTSELSHLSRRYFQAAALGRIDLRARAADLSARRGGGGSGAASPVSAPAATTTATTTSAKTTKPFPFTVTSGTVSPQEEPRPTAAPRASVSRMTAAPAEPGAPLLPFQTSSPKVRLHTDSPNPKRVSLAFRSRGPVTSPELLASGTLRHQLGVFLLGADQCNVLYVMLRQESQGASRPTVRLAVQAKTNPGRVTHGDCGNQGYTTLAPLKGVPPAEPPHDLLSDGKTHILTAEISPERQLHVTLDGRKVWQSELPPAVALRLGQPGILGVRSDNLGFEFQVSETKIEDSQGLKPR